VNRVAAERRRGRGAASNEDGRFETLKRLPEDDGWEGLGALPPFTTEVVEERARHIITRNASPDISFEQSINPYQGCEHGCAYCFARPTHGYWGLSAGLDFETRLFAKTNAAELLEKELAAPDYKPKTIAIGTNTDPYQPIERQRRIMRRVLEVLEAHNHPVAVLTKSALIARDLDILSRMAEKGLAKAALSITTLDHRLSRAMEPRAAAPQRRLETVRLLAEAGIPTAVMVAPVIPALNDTEIEKILMGAAAAGAREAGYILLRLPLEVAPLFRQWLYENMPDRAEHVLSLLKDMRGGKDYDASWGQRMRGRGPYAWLLGRRFEMAAKRFSLNKTKTKLRTDLFSPPPRRGEQLKLFA
jgi:DNA repair photolyase